MSKYNNKSSNNNNDNNTSFSYNVNNQNNDNVNNYQEQALQSTKEISEKYIESQKSLISSFHSAWAPYQRNVSITVNSWNSPEAVANAYSRWVSNVADNTVAALRTTNNLVFASLDAYKTTMQHAKENTKQILDINTKTAQTFEQNSRELARAAQDSDSRFNASINNNSGSGRSNIGTSTTTSTASVA